MRRKLAALLLCLLLVFQLSPVPSGAAETVYFTAVNKNVLTLSDDTMPFWSGGYLYVPSTIFTGVGRDLGVSYYPILPGRPCCCMWTRRYTAPWYLT